MRDLFYSKDVTLHLQISPQKAEDLKNLSTMLSMELFRVLISLGHPLVKIQIMMIQ